MKTKQKTLLYKIATGAKENSTLQGDLLKRLDLRKKARERLQKLSPDGDDFRLINDTRRHSNMLFGALHCFVEGAAQVVIGLTDDDSTEWPVEHLLPPASDKVARREFVNGLLFFGIWKNHVILLQSSGCRSQHLEEYLNWFINFSGADTANNGEEPPPLICLNDVVPKDIRKKPFKQVRSLKLKSGLESEGVTIPSPQKTQSEVTKLRFTPSGKKWDAVLTFVKELGAIWSDDLSLEDALKGDEVRIDLELTCRKKHESTAGTVLNHLANAMRNVESDCVELNFSDGSRLRGQDLKVERKVKLECDNNVPLFYGLHVAMISYLRDLIDGGTIISDEKFEIDSAGAGSTPPITGK